MIDTMTIATKLTPIQCMSLLQDKIGISEDEALSYIAYKFRTSSSPTYSGIDRKIRALFESYKTQFKLEYIRFCFSKKTGSIYLIIKFHLIDFVPISFEDFINDKFPIPYQLFSGNEEEVSSLVNTYCTLIMNLFFNSCPWDELELLRDFNNASIWRIDYSFNLKVPENLVSLYLHQFNGSVIEKNRLKKRTRFKYDSVYLKNQSLAVSIYDKHKECIAKNRPDLDYTKGILRYEVRFLKARLVKSLKNKYGFTNRELLQHDFAQSILLNYWLLLLPTGDFYKGTAANKRIRSELPTRQANKLIRFQKYLQDKHSVNTARKGSTYTTKTFDTNLKTLNDMDIAPFLVPINKSKEYGISKYRLGSVLPNPYKQIA